MGYICENGRQSCRIWRTLIHTDIRRFLKKMARKHSFLLWRWRPGPSCWRLDNAIHWMNHHTYALDIYKDNLLRYPVDSDLSNGWCYPPSFQGRRPELCAINKFLAKRFICRCHDKNKQYYLQQTTNANFRSVATKHITSARICRVVFLSLSVALCGSLFTVSKSTVMPKGIATSSVRA